MNRIKLSYQKRVFLLLPGLLVFFIIIYKYSLTETISLRKELMQKRYLLSELDENVDKVSELKERLTHFDQFLNIADPSYSHQKIILDFISDYCRKHDVRVTEMPGVHHYAYRDYIVITQQATVEGTFSSLLLFLNDLELNYKNGKIFSVKYYIHENRRIKEKKLHMSLYFQIIQNEKTDGTI